MGILPQDLRRTLRSLLRTPALSIAALTCIALGVGAAVFIFTVTDGVLARQLPFPHSDRLMRVWKVDRASGADRAGVSYPDYKDLAQARGFEAVELVARMRIAIVTDDGAERVRGEAVTPGYFAMIGVKPGIGRFFAEPEYRPEGARVIVIGYELWQRKYAGRRDIIGQSVRTRGFSEGRANDELRTIVGVMPPGFAGTVDEDISEFWVPVEHYAPRSLIERRDMRMCWVMARLREGVSIGAAQTEIAALGARIAAENPDAYENISLRVEPLGEFWRSQFRTGLLMLSGAAILLLLIASTNIANLLLARLAQREHELTVRMALGATPARIGRQLLTESVMLAMLGGLIGVAAAFAGVKLFMAREVIALPSYVTISPDGRVVLFAIAVVLVTGILFGTLPALFASRLDTAGRLREATRGGTQGRRQRLIGQGLVILEVALTVVLLVSSALMLRTYGNLSRGDLGFRTKNVLRMAITLDATAYGSVDAQLRFANEVREAFGRQPGVRNVSLVGGVLPPWSDASVGVAVDGRPIDALADVRRHPVDDAFFDVLDVRLLHGRAVASSDGPGSARVTVIDQHLARQIAGGDGSGAVGRSIQFVNTRPSRSLSPPVQVVGIVENLRFEGPLADIGRTGYDLYMPLAQAPDNVLSIAVLTSVDPASLIRPLQKELGRLAPSSPTHWISTMEEELALQYQDARLYAWLSTIFGVTALLLAVIGVYGVLANAVSRRFVELGVRMALGATGRDIARLVLRQGMSTLLAGLVAGGILAVAATRLLASLLYGIAPSDPVSYVVVAATLVLSGALAAYLPARRAAKVDPLIVMQRH